MLGGSSAGTTYIGVEYILSKSFPLRFAFMKVGPRAGTRYNVARSANIENPTEVYRAGKGGTGSIKGLTTNQAAIGMVEPRKIVGRGRGDKAALLVAPGIVCSGRVQGPKVFSTEFRRSHMPNLDLDTNHLAPEHLNSSGCCIKYSEGKGRGVYGNLLHLSPNLCSHRST